MPRQSRQPVPSSNAEIARATNIEPTAIQEEYCAVPADLHHWAAKVAEQDELLDISEANLKSFEAKEAVRLTEVAIEGGDKVPGEAKITAAIRATAAWREHAGTIIKMRRAKADAFAVLEAIRAKKEMLISLGATQRLELERDGLIRDRQRRA